MKYYSIKKELLILYFIFITSIGFGQRFSPSLDFTNEVSMATGKSFRKVFGLGNGIGLNFSIPIIKDKILLQPTVSVHYFGNYYNQYFKDNMQMLHYGGNLGYNFNIKKSFFLSPIIGLTKSKGVNYLNVRRGYAGEGLTFFNYKGVAFSIGIRISFRKWYFQPNYTLLKVNPIISEKLENDFKTQNHYDDELYDVLSIEHLGKMSLNRLNLSIGYRIKFK